MGAVKDGGTSVLSENMTRIAFCDGKIFQDFRSGSGNDSWSNEFNNKSLFTSQ